MTFEQFRNSEHALATLRIIYDVMEAARPHYPDNPWLQQPVQQHLHHAFHHVMRSWEDPLSVDDGKGAQTGKKDWHHGLTRLSMIAYLEAPQITPEAPTLDTTDIEASGE